MRGMNRRRRGLRIAALAIDWSIGVLTLTVVSLAAIDTAPVNAISMRSWQERLDDLWFADFALAMYWGGLTTLVFRLAASVVFGTTPGRKLTGLRIVANAGGRPAGRGLIALRDLSCSGSLCNPGVERGMDRPSPPGFEETWLARAAHRRRCRAKVERRRATSIQGFRIHGRFPQRDARKPFAIRDSAAMEATDRTDSEREMSAAGTPNRRPCHRRMGAPSRDECFFPSLQSPEVSDPVDPTLIRNLLRALAVV